MPIDGCPWAFLNVQAAIGDLICQGTDHETNNGAGCDRSENRVATVIIVHPVIAMRRIIEAPIVIITDDNRIGVIAVITANPIGWDIMPVIDEPESWPRIVIERPVSTPVIGAWRIAPEVMATVIMAIMVAIMVTSIIPVEIPVVAVMPI